MLFHFVYALSALLHLNVVEKAFIFSFVNLKGVCLSIFFPPYFRLHVKNPQA